MKYMYMCAVLLCLVCCFALFVCLTLLASFFLPSHLSFKNMYNVHVCMYIHDMYVHVVIFCVLLYLSVSVVVGD